MNVTIRMSEAVIIADCSLDRIEAALAPLVRELVAGDRTRLTLLDRLCVAITAGQPVIARHLAAQLELSISFASAASHI